MRICSGLRKAINRWSIIQLLGIMVPILLIVIVFLLGVCFKLSTENIALKEAQEEQERIATEYQDAYNQIVSDMLADGALLETNGNLIVKVWNNAIWNKQDEETDKYTMLDGVFVSDFNDALNKLFNDSDFSSSMADLYSNQQQIRIKMKNLTNPPKGFENAYSALVDMYEAYLVFSDMVINTNGSLESFSKEFSDADDDFIKNYRNADLYVK